MMFNSISAVAIVALLHAWSVDALTAGKPDRLSSYEIREASWLINVFPGKDPVRLNGTMEEVHKQALALNPNFPPLNTTVGPPLGFDPAGPPKIKGLGSDSVPFSPRWMVKRDVTKCFFDALAYSSVIQQNINNLRGFPGKPTIRAGFAACEQVSCSYNSAIWWCNDNPWPVELYAFNRIADGAQVVLNDCQYEGINWGEQPVWYTQGQRFDNDLVNFLVRGERC